MSLVVATTTDTVLSCAASALEVNLGGYRYLSVRSWDGMATRETSVDLGTRSVRFTFAHADAMNLGRLVPVEQHVESRARSYAEAASFLQCVLEVLPEAGPEKVDFANNVARRLEALLERCRRLS